MFVLSGCGGTKVLKEAQPIQTTQPLATVSDQQVTAILDWVIVRDGPGTWAKNADWDEYLLRIRNLSEQSISRSSSGRRYYRLSCRQVRNCRSMSFSHLRRRPAWSR